MEALAMSISDGQAVDWEAAERSMPDERRREVIHYLKLVAEIAVGRGWDPEAGAAAVGSDRSRDLAGSDADDPLQLASALDRAADRDSGIGAPGPAAAEDAPPGRWAHL